MLMRWDEPDGRGRLRSESVESQIRESGRCPSGACGPAGWISDPAGRPPHWAAQNPVGCRLSIRSRSRGIQKSIRDSQLAAQHALEMFRRTLLIGACTQVPRPALQRLTKIGTEARKLRTLWKMGRDWPGYVPFPETFQKVVQHRLRFVLPSMATPVGPFSLFRKEDPLLKSQLAHGCAQR